MRKTFEWRGIKVDYIVYWRRDDVPLFSHLNQTHLDKLNGITFTRSVRSERAIEDLEICKVTGR